MCIRDRGNFLEEVLTNISGINIAARPREILTFNEISEVKHKSKNVYKHLRGLHQTVRPDS